MKNINKKKVLKAVGIIFGILTVFMTAAALVFSANAGKQVAEGLVNVNAGNDTKANSLLQLEENGYDLLAFEEKYMSAAKEITVLAEDGNIIPAEIFTCKEESKNTVILVHGQGGDHVMNYPVAEIYLEKNWNVITFDQRGAGESKDDKVTYGYYEKFDVKALVDYAKAEMKAEHIVVHGQSMGAATAALYAETQHAEQNVEGVILDSCYDSLENLFLGIWRQMDTEGIPEAYIVACGNWYLKTHYGFSFEDVDITEKMKELKIPVLMLQMERDEIVSTQAAHEMFENIVAKDKKICYFDSEHIGGIRDYKKEYAEAVFSFLNER